MKIKYFEIFQHLLEDISSNKSRAEQILAQNPVADQEHVVQTLSSGKAAFTSITHLISEIVLLQTAARDQQESLKLAVSEKEKYETEISYLNNVIAEAGKKMEHSPVSVTSVGALKQQITEQNVSTFCHFNKHAIIVSFKTRLYMSMVRL